MPIIQTPKELGLAIRARRKEVGWGQATLANQIGVTRQWVIDIEKGKPRAELALAMRALRVLGMSLTVESRTEAASRDSSGNDRRPGAKTPDLDINAIVERNRRSADSPASGSTAAHPLQAIEAASRLDRWSGLNPSSAAADLLSGTNSFSRLADLAYPKLPITATDHMREIEAVSRLDCLTSSQVRKRKKSTEEMTAPKRPGSKTP